MVLKYHLKARLGQRVVALLVTIYLKGAIVVLTAKGSVFA